MAYDNDLKWMMRLIWALLIINISFCIIFACRHEWYTSAAFLIWVFNIGVWSGTIQQSQRTRDMIRVVQAAAMDQIEQ